MHQRHELIEKDWTGMHLTATEREMLGTVEGACPTDGMREHRQAVRLARNFAQKLARLRAQVEVGIAGGMPAEPGWLVDPVMDWHVDEDWMCPVCGWAGLLRWGFRYGMAYCAKCGQGHNMRDAQGERVATPLLLSFSCLEAHRYVSLAQEVWQTYGTVESRAVPPAEWVEAGWLTLTRQELDALEEMLRRCASEKGSVHGQD